LTSPPDRSAARIGVVKAATEQRYTLAVAYPADRVDLQGEYMTAAELEKAAWAYAARYRGVGLVHVDGTDGAGTVVESYIYRGPDWTVRAPNGASVVVKSGDWLLGITWDDTAWRLIRSGRLDGMSMQGSATHTRVSAR
jgi:hypothetical protein